MNVPLKPLLIALALIVALIPTGFPETVYARVGQGSGLATRRAAELGVSGSPEFVLVDEELFVRRQVDWGSLFFDYGKRWSWDAENIARFRRHNPNLDAYWDEYMAKAGRMSRVYGR